MLRLQFGIFIDQRGKFLVPLLLQPAALEPEFQAVLIQAGKEGAILEEVVEEGGVGSRAEEEDSLQFVELLGGEAERFRGGVREAG